MFLFLKDGWQALFNYANILSMHFDINNYLIYKKKVVHKKWHEIMTKIIS